MAQQQILPWHLDYLYYYVIFLTICSFYMIPLTLLTPTRAISQLYRPTTPLTSTGIRLWFPWMAISTALRVAWLLHWPSDTTTISAHSQWVNSSAAKVFTAWMDATVISWVAAVLYFNMEFWGRATVLRQQYLVSTGLDCVAVTWCLVVRGAIAG